MMVLSIVLMVIAAGLLIAEAFVPDFGVMGITGIVLLVVAAVATVVYVPYGGFILAGELAFLGTGVVLLISRARRKQTGSHFILKETLDEVAPEYGDLQAYIGRYGVAKTSLRPFGVVEVAGVSFDVTSDGIYIAENSNVQVVKADGGRLVVKQAGEVAENIN